MGRGRKTNGRLLAWVLVLGLGGKGAEAADGATVSGVVRMPEVCSPAVSPAVVYLAPATGSGTAAGLKQPKTEERAADGARTNPAKVGLVNQQGLQFAPRVQAIALGQKLIFGNQDGETHNVHVVSPGFAFNESMAPGKYRYYEPEKAGVLKLACDIHTHMRGFVVVSPTPWVQVCDRDGRFRLGGVPAGRYVLHVWHEMGPGLSREISVTGGDELELPPLVLTAGLDQIVRGGSPAAASVRPWTEVIDRIGVVLAASRDAASRSGDTATARRLADDAYWGEFEASDFETAVRTFLGFARAGELERQFRAIRTLVRDGANRHNSSQPLADACHRLLADLLAASREFSAKGVTDRSQIDALAKRGCGGGRR